jgi:hypothetical protein
VSVWLAVYAICAVLMSWVTEGGMRRDHPNRPDRRPWIDVTVFVAFGLLWPVTMPLMFVQAFRHRPR